MLLASAPLTNAQPQQDDTRELLLELRRDLRELRAQVDTRLRDIESRLGLLESGESDPSPSPEADPNLEELLKEATALTELDPTPAPVQPTVTQSLNPQISVIGDFLGAARANTPDEFAPETLSLREVELAFQSRIDPFARADFYVTVPSLESVELEEGFVSFLALPSDLLVRVGKIRLPFGRANVDHRPETFTVDRPDVLTAYFGDEGLSEMGVSVARLVPNPWDLFMEFEADVVQGANDTSFGGGEARDLLYNLRYRVYYDLTDQQNVHFGISYADGVNELLDGERFRSRLAGIDIAYRWNPLRRGAYQSLLWQTELMRGRRDALDKPIDTWGFYSLLRYQLGRRWHIGGRIDRSPDPLDAEFGGTSQSAFLEFYPSEFQRFRVQYKHSDLGLPEDAHQLFFQWYYLIGTHGAHRF